MRIALFAETYLPHINGVVTHVKSLKDGLEQLGHEVLVVTADADARRHFIADGVLHCPAHTSQRFYGYGVALPISTTRLQFIRRFRPDIIHVHQEFGIGLSGIMIAKLLRVALVYTLHTMYDEYVYYVAPQPLIPITRELSHKYTKLFARSAQALTGPSKKCEEYFRKVGVYKPVNVIPNPVDLDAFTPGNLAPEQRSALRARFGFDDRTFLGVFVGRLGREKSVDLLLRYWRDCISPEENIRLLVVGEGPSREELEQLAAELEIQNMVVFAGKILHEEIPPYLEICDFYITASTSDTNSISMLEGMASGLPVLQITDPLNEGQVQDGVNGFIFADAQDMAEKIRHLRDMSPEQRAKLCQSSRQSVEQSGATNLAQYVLRVYNHALHEKRRKYLHYRHMTAALVPTPFPSGKKRFRLKPSRLLGFYSRRPKGEEKQT